MKKLTIRIICGCYVRRGWGMHLIMNVYYGGQQLVTLSLITCRKDFCKVAAKTAAEGKCNIRRMFFSTHHLHKCNQ